jgi:hypothetical protein
LRLVIVGVVLVVIAAIMILVQESYRYHNFLRGLMRWEAGCQLTWRRSSSIRRSP